jgi:hypothetical protein
VQAIVLTSCSFPAAARTGQRESDLAIAFVVSRLCARDPFGDNSIADSAVFVADRRAEARPGSAAALPTQSQLGVGGGPAHHGLLAPSARTIEMSPKDS